MIPLEILVQNEDLQKMMEKGFAEVAFRQADSKFLKMVKCPIGNAVQNASAAPVSPVSSFSPNISNVMNNAINLFIGDNGKVYDAVRKSARQIMKTTLAGQGIDTAIGAIETGVLRNDIAKVGRDVKAIALNIDKMLPMIESIQTVEYLSLAVNLAGIAVTAAGFAAVNSKLDNISAQLDEMKDIMLSLGSKVDDLLNIWANEIKEEFNDINMRFVHELDVIKHDEIDEKELDKMEALVRNMTTFIGKLVRNVEDGVENSISMVEIAFTLLPMHSCILQEYMKAFKFIKKRDIPNFELFTDIYKEMSKKEFIEKISDHYFLEEKKNYAQVCDIVNGHILLISNAQVNAYDMRELLGYFDNKEQYVLIETALENAAKDYLIQEIPHISEYTGESEEVCRSYFLGEEI